jgi:hypothetical protein
MAIVPLSGDRSAWDMDYPERHASDLDAGQHIYHLPQPGSSMVVLYSADGVSWSAVALNSIVAIGTTRQTIFTLSGNLSVQSGVLRIYNLFGIVQTIARVFLSSTTAPTGASIIVDIHKDGSTIFTNQGNRPTVDAGNNAGESTSIDNPLWMSGEYITADVDQIGSVVAGSDLVIHVIHSDTAMDSVDSQTCYIEGCGEWARSSMSSYMFCQASVTSYAHAFLDGGGITSRPAFTRAMNIANMGLDEQWYENPAMVSYRVDFSTEHQFTDEPIDTDTQITTGSSSKIEVRYSGLYEIIVHVGGNTISDIMVKVNGTTICSEDLIGSVWGTGDPVVKASQTFWHWFGNLTAGDDIELWATCNTAVVSRIYGDDKSYSARVIVRRLD